MITIILMETEVSTKIFKEHVVIITITNLFTVGKNVVQNKLI